MKKQLLISAGILMIISVITVLIILYGKGYINFTKGKLEFTGTGILVAKSVPDGAEVWINNNLTTATNNTINLKEGMHYVEIRKQGYFSWKKTINVKKEVVSKAEAFLLSTRPTLQGITATEVNNPVLDPLGNKIAFTVSSESAKRDNGIYILNMNTGPIPTLQSNVTQITNNDVDSF